MRKTKEQKREKLEKAIDRWNVSALYIEDKIDSAIAYVENNIDDETKRVKKIRKCEKLRVMLTNYCDDKIYKLENKLSRLG